MLVEFSVPVPSEFPGSAVLTLCTIVTLPKLPPPHIVKLETQRILNETFQDLVEFGKTNSMISTDLLQWFVQWFTRRSKIRLFSNLKLLSPPSIFSAKLCNVVNLFNLLGRSQIQLYSWVIELLSLFISNRASHFMSPWQRGNDFFCRVYSIVVIAPTHS